MYDRPGSLEKAGQDYVFDDSKPLFEFGDGLSYTKFEYSNLKVEKINSEYHVSVDVSNVGNYDADESVLVYTKSDSNIMVCPCVKKLRAFKRVTLNKDETKTIKLVLTKDDFSYIGLDMKKTYPLNKVRVIVKDLEVQFDI